MRDVQVSMTFMEAKLTSDKAKSEPKVGTDAYKNRFKRGKGRPRGFKALKSFADLVCEEVESSSSPSLEKAGIIFGDESYEHQETAQKRRQREMRKARVFPTIYQDDQAN